MGICCTVSTCVPILPLQKYSSKSCSIDLSVGNIIYQHLDAIIIPSNIILKFPISFLSTETIHIQKLCVERIKDKGKLIPGEIFASEGVYCKTIVYAVCPDYSDGTLGEPDYLSMAYTSALNHLTSLNLSTIGISVDWVYPKAKFSKILTEIIVKFTQSFSSISVFSMDPHIVTCI